MGTPSLVSGPTVLMADQARSDRRSLPDPLHPNGDKGRPQRDFSACRDRRTFVACPCRGFVNAPISIVGVAAMVVGGRIGIGVLSRISGVEALWLSKSSRC